MEAMDVVLPEKVSKIHLRFFLNFYKSRSLSMLKTPECAVK